MRTAGAKAPAVRLGIELALSTRRAIEDELVICVEIGTPAVLVRRQRHLTALRALWDLGDLFGSHGRDSKTAATIPWP
jgi:hypothetical protein